MSVLILWDRLSGVMRGYYRESCRVIIYVERSAKGGDWVVSREGSISSEQGATTRDSNLRKKTNLEGRVCLVGVVSIRWSKLALIKLNLECIGFRVFYTQVQNLGVILSILPIHPCIGLEYSIKWRAFLVTSVAKV